VKRFYAVIVILALGTLVFSTGRKEKIDVEQWPQEPLRVTCPWAVGGVVDVVNRKLATYGEEVFGYPIIATNDFIRSGTISISDDFLDHLSSMLGDSGNVAFSNYLKRKGNSTDLIIGSENIFAIAPVMKGSRALPFDYDDFEPVINLCSAIFVLTTHSDLNITNLLELKLYSKDKVLVVAVGGTTSIEAFMVQMLLDELDIEYKIIGYNGANVALDALMNGEVDLAVSHKSQAREWVESGILSPVVIFDEEGETDGVYAGVKGVGEYGYTSYSKNRSFLLARKGTDPAIIQKIYEGYCLILAKDDVKELYDSLMIEMEPLGRDEIDRHIANVKKMVKSNL